jgi:hypothetical protein
MDVGILSNAPACPDSSNKIKGSLLQFVKKNETMHYVHFILNQKFPFKKISS